MTKIRIATTEPRQLAKPEVRPWLRYLALLAIAGFVALLLFSPVAEHGFEKAMRAMMHWVGQ